ncbi:MAG: AbrB/MazE/SpoVT family DNA-binding domain-containing protein [Clostridia bacterium]|nr:AbrB/MazE/SpoVT family DNA-binding domain-containing protein [Clostridia bacterium]
MATVRVGEKGQVVIPKEIREMFGIQSGDSMLMLADSERGIAIVRPEFCQALIRHVMGGQELDEKL